MTTRTVDTVGVAGATYERRRCRAAVRVPAGYHSLRVADDEALVVACPPRAPDPSGRLWGVFLPLYALQSDRSWGVGDVSDLAALCAWTGAAGGQFVATLPLYSQFLDGPLVDASPYAPVSRLFWNELYADPERAPELARCPEAREVLGSEAFRADLAKARAGDLVEYELVYALRRRVLEPLARTWSGGDLPEHAADYARFRGAVVRFGRRWSEWPAAAAAGQLRDCDVDSDECLYHAYVQRLVRRQLDELASGCGRDGVRLYLDLPLGVHRDGYDTWRHRDAFAPGVRAGAPPDQLFAGGQDWGFPPPSPVGLRESRYGYLIASLRETLSRAGVLRLDHVMGLHRLFWIPDGLEASEGVYVRYPSRELYAILLVEAHRAGAVVVGEDLGTVPSEVRSAMASRGVFRTFVQQFEHRSDVPEHAFASLNTHDLEPFAAFWEREGDGGEAPVREYLSHLAASAARAVVVSLEDLWGETERQNLPGSAGGASWRRRARVPLEAFGSDARVAGVLREVEALRRGDRP